MADVSVIGLGRVGLPLALAFADRGLSVVGIDHDAGHLAAIRSGRMPFEEPEAQAALERVRAGGRVEVSESGADSASADHGVILLGTPSFAHSEIDRSGIRSVLD